MGRRRARALHDGGAVQAVGVSGSLRVNHYSAIRRITLAGAGVARLPRDLVQEELEAGTRVTLLDDYPLVTTLSWLVQPYRRHQAMRNRAFAELLQHRFEAPRWRAQFA